MTEREHAVQHIYQLMYGDLHICGCGQPNAAYELVRSIVLARSTLESRSAMETLIPHDGARHLVMSALDEASVLDHGTVIDSAWLTRKGQYFAHVMPGIEWDDVDQQGYPHPYGGEQGVDPCTAACWDLPGGGGR